MSEQVVDLRSSWAIARRRPRLLAVVAVWGALAGGAVGYQLPPVYTSTSIVLLPPAPQGSSAAADAHGIDTQVEIAKSEAVLGPAGEAVRPPLAAARVSGLVDIEASTTDVLTITARGATAARAESLADAVAKAEIAYLQDASSAAGRRAQGAVTSRADTLKSSLSAVNDEIKKTQQRLSREAPGSAAGRADATALSELTAQQANLALQIDQLAADQSSDPASAGASVIQQASPGRSTPWSLRLGLYAAVGAGVLLLLVASLVVLRGRRERTMRSKDEIADAVGAPVAASVKSLAPRSVAAWGTLLEKYTPGHVESWTLRQLLRVVTPGHVGSVVRSAPNGTARSHVRVVTLSGDRRALAFGPQLATFAASTGLRTCLLAVQHHDSASSLLAACAGVPPGGHPRPGLSIETKGAAVPDADLVVDVAVVDRTHPLLRLPGEGMVTLLAVTAGAASAEDLARVALAADDSGHAVDRVVVVDPDPLDRSTGRLLPTERAEQVPLPSLMTGGEIAGEATVLERRRRRR